MRENEPVLLVLSVCDGKIILEKGEILYEKNSKEQLPPASMTKIMTMLLIMEALDKGKLKLDEKVRASEYAASMGGSQIFLEPGEEMTVKEIAEAFDLNPSTVRNRIRAGKTEEEIIATTKK